MTPTPTEGRDYLSGIGLAEMAAAIDQGRILKRMTHAQLCARSGVDRSTWNRLRNGRSVQALSVLCLAEAVGLGVRVMEVS